MGIASIVTACTVLGGSTFALWSAAQEQYARATAVAAGGVVDVFGEDELDVTVEWTDAGGDAHRDDFYVHAEADAAVGVPFAVRYDPADPSGEVFPADLERASGPGEDAMFTGFLGVSTGLVWLLGWAVRLGRNRWAAAAVGTSTGTPMELIVMGAQYKRGRRTFAALMPPSSLTEPPLPARRKLLHRLSSGRKAQVSSIQDRYYQAVVWEPVLDQIAGALTPVTVYPCRGGRAVIVLPDGHRLTPAGRLLAHEPGSWTLTPRGTPRKPARRTIATPFGLTWLILLPAAFIGVTSAGLLGVAIAVPCFALLGSAFWAWNGAEPTRQ
ncbi:DUF3592 domain-containing protein [Kineococcus xinjiangensis]|uniref:DUF3592 domain-containing protein n=1 Tax=Kineococcus xinjiangensis TaxID=512762 RepID=UPI000CEB98C8|nr:DUF3592 domain-containing protein [Kineococcus xinjiangensis]